MTTVQTRAWIGQALKIKWPPRGYFTVAFRDQRGRIESIHKFPNGLCLEGLNAVLNTGFGGAATLTWRIGLINAVGFGSLSINDTAAKITTTTPTSATNQWQELTNYTGTTRQLWTPGTAAGGIITNAVARTFTINATVDIRGLFITTGINKGAVAGVIWATGLFPSGDQHRINTQTMDVHYTLIGAEGTL